MRQESPFLADDLDALDELLAQADAVVPLEDVVDGARGFRTIGLRHDIDHDLGPALAFARWEADRGYRATYYLLHTAPYWRDRAALELAAIEIIDLGHRVGIHNNAIGDALRTGFDPVEILAEATEVLRGYGCEIRSTVAHGDELCGRARFVNDAVFVECARPPYGEPRTNPPVRGRRTIEYGLRSIEVDPVPLASLGLDFDANWIARTEYISDSGGRWSRPFADVVDLFPPQTGQLHMLVHPTWWRHAFSTIPAASGRKG